MKPEEERAIAELSGTNGTHPADLTLAIVTGTIGALGAPGNLFLLCLILSEYKKRKPHEWLFFSLALGDFLLCVSNAVLEAPFVVNPYRVECKIAAALDYILGMMSFVTPPLVAYNRYLSLYENTRYQRLFTNRFVLIAWGLACIWALCWVSPFMITDSLGKDDVGLCGLQLKNYYLKANMVLGCLVAMGAYSTLVFYAYKVVLKIRQHKKEAARRSRIQSRLINESQEIITALLLSSGVPFFAQIPIAITKMWPIFPFLSPLNPWISRLSAAPFPLTSAVNAYVTVYVVKDYRRKAISLVKSAAVAPLTSRGGRSGMEQSERRTAQRSYGATSKPNETPNQTKV